MPTPAQAYKEFEVHPDFMNINKLLINFAAPFLQMAGCRSRLFSLIEVGDQAMLPVNVSERCGPRRASFWRSGLGWLWVKARFWQKLRIRLNCP